MGGFHTYHTLLLAADNGQTHPIKAVLYCTFHTLRRTHTNTHPLLRFQHLTQSQETDTVVFSQLALLVTATVI